MIGRGGVNGNALQSRVASRQSLTIRIPESLIDDLRSAAKTRGLSITDVVESVLTNQDLRPNRSEAAVDAAPWTALGYRVTRAHAALDANDVEAARGELAAARAAIVETLRSIRMGYDASLDGRNSRDDDWSGKR